MMKKQMMLFCGVLLLSGCQSFNPIDTFWSDKPEATSTTSPLTETNATSSNKSKPETPEPSSYYLQNGMPESHQNMDKNWVSAQSYSSYTLELAQDNKASTVAKILTAAPKDQRSAQISYVNSATTTEEKPVITYIGLYGSYNNLSDAQTALAKLPASLQNSAHIVQWKDIQTHLNA